MKKMTTQINNNWARFQIYFKFNISKNANLFRKLIDIFEYVECSITKKDTIKYVIVLVKGDNSKIFDQLHHFANVLKGECTGMFNVQEQKWY